MRILASFGGRYDRAWLPKDLIAGLTVWAVLVPESLAYATIAGVSPVIGLYAAPAALVLYAAFGSSRHLVVGPMAATAALSAAAVADLAVPGDDRFLAMTVALALVVGLLALVAGFLRLGFLATFISEPVLKGFIVGLALTVIAGQLHKLTGTPDTSGNFFEEVAGWIGSLDETSLPTLAIGLISLSIVVGFREFLPVVPGSLIAVGFGIAATSLLGLDQQGVDIVGPIQSGLPTIGLPNLALGDYLALLGPALGITLVAFAEGLGAAKTYAARDGYEIDANQELIGLGASNLGSGLSGGMVVNGSLSKTAVNAGAGARTEVSAVFAAVVTVVTLLFLTGLFEKLPEATLGAIVIAALVELVDFRSLAGYYRLWTGRLASIYGAAARADFIAAMAALVGVLVFDTLPGLAIGVVVSIVLLVYRSSRPHVAVLGRVPGAANRFADIERGDDIAVVPGVAILRPEAPLFFANADRVRDAVKSAASPADVRIVILDLETVPEVDLTAARMIAKLAGELEKMDRTLVIAHSIGQVREVLTLEGGDVIRVYPTVAEAVAAGAADPVASPGAPP